MSSKENQQPKTRSFLCAREPSIDFRFRPRPERQIKLFEQGIPEENVDLGENCSSNQDEDPNCLSETENGDSVLVYLRLRPIETSSTAYIISESTLITRRPGSYDSNITMNNKNTMEKHYTFSAIFDSEVGQREMYERCIGRKIESDESFTMLTYGTSGSGKTFTLLGDDNNPGIVPRSMENIFTLYAKNIYPNPSMKLVKASVTILDDDALAREIQLRRQLIYTCDETQNHHLHLQEIIRSDHAFVTTQLNQVSVLIWISFVEIYNELVYDLLTPLPSVVSGASSKSLKIVGNDGKVFIKGLTTVYVKSSLEALKLLRYGLQRVNYATTSINANSSRSHCIFIVDVIKYFSTGQITETSYKFCDLAGSERLHKTGNVGSRLKEAQCINTSLMVLGRCLDAANANRKKTNEVIPYRESKLTMLLQAALLGKEKLTMIVNVTPIDTFIEENLNVLSFASIAKNIIFKQPVIKRKNSSYSLFIECSKPSVGPSNSNNEYVKQLLEENKNLREDLDRLNIEMSALKSQHKAELLQHLEENKNLHEDLDRLSIEMSALKSQHMAELLQQEQELRIQLVDSFKITLQERKQQFEARLQQELLFQERLFESRMSSLKRKYEYEIEDLREEYEEQSEDFNPESTKKRNTLN